MLSRQERDALETALWTWRHTMLWRFYCRGASGAQQRNLMHDMIARHALVVAP